jgi:hypothetical protein
VIFFFFYFPLYLQSVPIHSANVVKACRRVLTSGEMEMLDPTRTQPPTPCSYKTMQCNLEIFFVLQLAFITLISMLKTSSVV